MKRGLRDTDNRTVGQSDNEADSSRQGAKAQGVSTKFMLFLLLLMLGLFWMSLQAVKEMARDRRAAVDDTVLTYANWGHRLGASGVSWPAASNEIRASLNRIRNGEVQP